jgi:ATPase subunit of ABC transporter with duplicated ATPase domains
VPTEKVNLHCCASLQELKNLKAIENGGHNIEESFYAQHQLEALNVNHTVIEEMMQAGSQKTELELRTLLGCFLFSGDDVEKKIKVLSGGEKARVRTGQNNYQ